MAPDRPAAEGSGGGAAGDGGTAQSEVGRILRVALKRPAEAWRDPASVEAEWEALGYTDAPDFQRAEAEHAALEGFFRRRGVAVDLLPAATGTGLDSIYVRDAAVVTDGGVVLCNMGKRAREAEPEAQGAYYRSKGLPVLGAVSGEGRLEGGDVVWLAPGVLAVGSGYRTNPEGIRGLERLTGDWVDEIIVVPLPHWRGPSDVFHLMSMLSPVDTDLALVHSPLLPVPFRRRLLGMGIELVETPGDEFDVLGANVLAVAPREILMVDVQPRTRSRLEAADVEVHVLPGAEIAVKGRGGPTCLTRPLARATTGREP